jgi:hypothetical protein
VTPFHASLHFLGYFVEQIANLSTRRNPSRFKKTSGLFASYTDSTSKLRFAACLPYGKTSFFFTLCRAVLNWKPYYLADSSEYPLHKKAGNLFYKRDHSGKVVI